MQVYFFPETIFVDPAFEHDVPAIVAALETKLEKTSVSSAATANIRRPRITFRAYEKVRNY